MPSKRRHQRVQTEGEAFWVPCDCKQREARRIEYNTAVCIPQSRMTEKSQDAGDECNGKVSPVADRRRGTAPIKQIACDTPEVDAAKDRTSIQRCRACDVRPTSRR
jgi:hypothetical protein